MEPSALIVFFKWVEHGRVKTRLLPLLSAAQVCALYRAFVLDTFAKVCALPSVSVWGFVAGKIGEGGELERALQSFHLPLVEQTGLYLGERMRNAFEMMFAHGFRQVAIIGTDSPDLPLARLESAFSALSLATPAICIAPAEDGGYVLLGMNRFFPELFENVPYSSADTYRATLRQACQLPARLFVLPRWYDVDTPSDLRRLAAQLDEAQLPQTAAALRYLPLP